MLVVQHPIVQAQLMAEERPQQVVAGIIAQAMLSGLDKFVSRAETGAEAASSTLNTPKLENLMLQLDHAPLADDGGTCQYQSGVCPHGFQPVRSRRH